MSEPRRTVRSYVVRGGRLTPAQQRALETIGPRLLVPEPACGSIDLDALYGRRAARTIEIGFGTGDALMDLAERRPERDFLGIDVYPPGVGRLLSRLDERGITNVRVAMADATVVLSEWLAPGSADEVLVWFPDPWPKKRHWKRRLVQAAFVGDVHRVLAPGGRFHLATDWEPYAHWMKEVVEADGGFTLAAPGAAFSPRPPDRPRTRFESRGERLGHAVFDLIYVRR